MPQNKAFNLDCISLFNPDYTLDCSRIVGARHACDCFFIRGHGPLLRRLHFSISVEGLPMSSILRVMQGDITGIRDLLEQAAAYRGLAGPHFAREQYESAAAIHAIEQMNLWR